METLPSSESPSTQQSKTSSSLDLLERWKDEATTSAPDGPAQKAAKEEEEGEEEQEEPQEE